MGIPNDATSSTLRGIFHECFIVELQTASHQGELKEEHKNYLFGKFCYQAEKNKKIVFLKKIASNFLENKKLV